MLSKNFCRLIWNITSILVMVCIFSGIVIAGEVAAPIVAPVVQASPSFMDLVGLDNMLKVALLIIFVMIGLGISYAAYKARNNQALHDAIEALRVGVDKTEGDFVEWRKRASADGKLTKDEIAQAQQLAISHAKDIASGPALNLLKSWGTSVIMSYITRIIEKKKLSNVSISSTPLPATLDTTIPPVVK